MNGVEVVASWLTPTIIFCVLNLMIGTIFVISGLKPRNISPKPNENDAVSQPQLARAPSLFERVKSIKLSFSRSENRDPVPVSTIHENAPNHDHDHVQARQRHEGRDFHLTRSKSDTGAKTSSSAPSVVMKKSTSEKVAAFEKEEVGRKLSELSGGDEGVDARADDFINRFRQQLKLQRLDSMLKFKEILKRRGSA